jgi:hypothetical protein
MATDEEEKSSAGGGKDKKEEDQQPITMTPEQQIQIKDILVWLLLSSHFFCVTK